MLIEITTHDGVTRKTTVETYDPVAINESINNGELLTVVIGDLIISRINVKEVLPVVVTAEGSAENDGT